MDRFVEWSAARPLLLHAWTQGTQHKLLFADYSINVMCQCKAFSSVCSTLHTNHVKFVLAYPVILNIQPATGERLSFTSPLEAENYLNATQPRNKRIPLLPMSWASAGRLLCSLKNSRALRNLPSSGCDLVCQMNVLSTVHSKPHPVCLLTPCFDSLPLLQF